MSEEKCINHPLSKLPPASSDCAMHILLDQYLIIDFFTLYSGTLNWLRTILLQLREASTKNLSSLDLLRAEILKTSSNLFNSSKNNNLRF